MTGEQGTFFQKTAGWLPIGVPLLIILAVFDTGVEDAALIPKLTGLAVFLFVLSVSLMIRKRTNTAILTWIEILLLVFLVASGISIFYTIAPEDAVYDWCKMALLFLSVWLTSRYYYEDKAFSGKLCLSVSAFSLAASIPGIISLAELVFKGNYSTAATYNIVFTFANRNVYAEVITLALPFCLAGVLILKGTSKRISAAALLASVLLLCGLLPREVIVAGGFMMLAFIAAYLFSDKHPVKKETKKLMAITLVFTLLSLVVFQLATPAGGPLNQLKRTIHPDEMPGMSRLELWNRSLKLIEEKPITGYGLSSWRIMQLKYNVGGTQQQDGITFFQNPHNDFLWIASETGIPVSLIWILLFGAVYVQVFRQLKRSGSRETTIFISCIIAGITGYIALSCFGFLKDRAETLVMLGLLLTAANVKDLKPPGGKKPRIIIYLVPCISAAIVCICMVRYVGEFYGYRAQIAWENDKLNTVVQETAEAEKYYYPVNHVSTPLSWYRGQVHYLGRNNDSALADYKKAYRYNPYHVHVLNNLATEYMLHKDTARAIGLFNSALHIDPYFNDALLNMAAFWFNKENADSALYYIDRVDTACKDIRYHDFIEKTVSVKAGMMSDTVKDPYVKANLVTLADAPAQCLTLYFEARKKNEPVEKVLIDAASTSLH